MADDATTWTYERFVEEASKTLGTTADDMDARIGGMLLAAAVHGSGQDKLRRFCKPFGKKMIEAWNRLYTQGVFSPEGKVLHSGWFDEDGGGIAFCMDVCVGNGMMARARVGGKKYRSKKVSAPPSPGQGKEK